MAKLVKPKDWLDHHSGRLAQDHAIRLVCCSSCTLPSDSALKDLVSDQVLSDLVGLAIHGRRLMERHKLNASITSDTLWPASAIAPSISNLRDAFGLLIHAQEIVVNWENADVTPNPYKSRQPVFAGCVRVTSDNGAAELPIGGLASTFVGQILNRLPTE